METAAKVAFLSRPDAYADSTTRVDTRETHMSWVFLTDTDAWKLKKPVRSDYLDFSTPDARRRNCEEEVRLNRRLAADVYLGVAPLTLDEEGNLRLGGNGQPVDWLVHMRRLPSERMFDEAIARRAWTDADARSIGIRLASFYKNDAQPAPMSGAEYRAQLSGDLLAARAELARNEYGLPFDLVHSAITGELTRLGSDADLFDRRADAGMIRECHGDLRPEHICLQAEPVIIDCLEFNRDLRLLDPVSELMFLALECERLGAPRAGAMIYKACGDMTGDRPPAPLLDFYKAFHACIRAKIAILHLRDQTSETFEKWRARAVEYLKTAAGDQGTDTVFRR